MSSDPTLSLTDELSLVYQRYASKPFKLFLDPEHRAQLSIDPTETNKHSDELNHSAWDMLHAPSADQSEIDARQHVIEWLLVSPTATERSMAFISSVQSVEKAVSYLLDVSDEEEARCDRINRSRDRSQHQESPRSRICVWVDDLHADDLS